MDFTNAFNCASHDKLFKKLTEKCICKKFLKIIIDSFKNRQEFVSYNGLDSNAYTLLFSYNFILNYNDVENYLCNTFIENFILKINVSLVC